MKNIFELEDAQEVEGDNVLIIDSLNLAFRYKHSKTKVFADDYIRTVRSLAKSYAAKYIIIACDYGKSEYRKNIYPEYKADREVLRVNQTEEEKQEFIDFLNEFNRTVARCEDEGFIVLKYKGVEADDIAAYISHYILGDSSHNHVWLISSDKDWDHLINSRVSRFSYITRKEYSINNWFEHYDYPVDKAVDIKAITGGKDNVLGIEGIGPKRALALVEEYGSAFDVYEAVPIKGKAKYIQNLNENADRILLNIQLIDKVTYCKDAIGKENIEDINKKLGEYL
jgi:5'-3' exonuclease